MKYITTLLIIFSATFLVFIPACTPAEKGISATKERGQKTSPRNGEYTHLEREIAGRNVAIWQPPSYYPRPWPLVIFSHGYHGCNTQSTFLTEALAEHGYFVVAPDHGDAYCGNAFPRSLFSTPDKEEKFSDIDAWTSETYTVRVEDIHIVINELRQRQEFRARVDWDNIGVIGHSLGGYTALGVGGAWPEWKMPQVKAILALSPYCLPFLERGDLGNIDAAVMYQGGTWDGPLTEAVEEPDGCYDQAGSPAYFINLRRAGHFAWTDIFPAHHETIILYSRWFFDTYLKNKNRAFPQGMRQAPTAIRK